MTTTGEDRGRIGAADVAALASIGAGAIHAAAAGVHAENPTLSRLFVLTAAAQILVGLVLLLRRGRLAAVATAVVNAGAVVAWVVTRTTGISWIDGLEQSESPQFADTACAGARRAGRRRGRRRPRPAHHDRSSRQPRRARRRPRVPSASWR